MVVVSPPKDSVPEAVLTRCLRELPHYVILRNEEDLFENLQRGGDIDLLVADLELAERILIRHLGAPIRIIRSSYVSGYSYDWGHVDLLPTVEWRGACYLPTEAVLEGRRLLTTGTACAEDRSRGSDLVVDESPVGRFLQGAVCSEDSSGRGDRRERVSADADRGRREEVGAPPVASGCRRAR